MTINPVQHEILIRLRDLPAGLTPLREHAERYTRYCSSIDLDKTLQIAHQPWAAPEAYAIRLFAPAKKAWFARFRERSGKAIPVPYQEFLLCINGCSLHDLDLFGLPPSMQGRPPVLDRTRSQPLDLGSANRNWIAGYATDTGQFHFGSRAWTEEENVGYFWSEQGLRAVRSSGEVVGEWRDLAGLLADELPVAETVANDGVPAEWWH